MSNSDNGSAAGSSVSSSQSGDGAPAWSPGGRQRQVHELFTLPASQQDWDLIIVGGGITGAGIYREAACRGLKVLLLEQQDFAWGTSSRSSKMVHGGLRYLASGQFALARDAVRERQALMAALPGLVAPLPFLMTHYRGGFPSPWQLDKLLAIYDWLAGKRWRQFIAGQFSDFWAPGVRATDLQGMTRYLDAVTDDARLVLRVLQEGNDHGGVALNYVRAQGVVEQGGRVTGLTVADTLTGNTARLQAKAVVNATGAWTDNLCRGLGRGQSIRPLRGSHLLVPQWRLPVAFAVSFFHPRDRRPVFVFPWEGCTVIGTTDLDHRADLHTEVGISGQELDYLLAAANHQFDQACLTAADVVSTWAGVRPVVAQQSDPAAGRHKPSDEKREHVIWNDRGLISIAGGKLTTYRLIALEVLSEVANSWSVAAAGVELQASDLRVPMPFTEQKTVSSEQGQRLLGRYGDRAAELQRLCAAPQPAGDDLPRWCDRVLTTDTLWAELVWACRHECVQHLDDLLLRRTRIALLLGSQLETCALQLQAVCCRELGWSETQWQEEWQRYQKIMAKYYGLPVDDDL